MERHLLRISGACGPVCTNNPRSTERIAIEVFKWGIKPKTFYFIALAVLTVLGLYSGKIASVKNQEAVTNS